MEVTVPVSGGAHAWRRFRRDRAALAGLAFIGALLVAAFAGAPLAAAALGHGPADIYPLGVDQLTGYPVGPSSHVDTAPYAGAAGDFDDTLFLLGGDRFGRDIFLRLLYGARTSLEVALLTSVLTFAVGGTLGLIAGFRRGWVDVVVSRLIEIAMVFPTLLFVISIRSVFGEQLNGITLGVLPPRGVVMMVLLATIGWFYPRGWCEASSSRCASRTSSTRRG